MVLNDNPNKGNAMRNIETLKKQLLEIDDVLEANIWQKHGKNRIYLELPKLNGGKNWNGGKAGTVFFDLYEDRISHKRDWAGARTRDSSLAIIKKIEERLIKT